MEEYLKTHSLEGVQQALTDNDIQAAWDRPSVNNQMSDEEKRNICTLFKKINRSGTTLLDNGEGTMYLLDHADKEDIEKTLKLKMVLIVD